MATPGVVVSALPLRGEVWWAEAPEVPRRPVVVLSRDAVVRGLRRALVSPCTTTVRGLPSEVGLDPAHDPVPRSCVTALDAVESVSVGALTQRLGRLSDARMRQVGAALAVSTGCA